MFGPTLKKKKTSQGQWLQSSVQEKIKWENDFRGKPSTISAHGDLNSPSGCVFFVVFLRWGRKQRNAQPFSNLKLNEFLCPCVQVCLGTPLTWRTVTMHLAGTSFPPRRPRRSYSWCGKLCRTSPSSSWKSLPSSHWACLFTIHQGETVKVGTLNATETTGDIWPCL